MSSQRSSGAVDDGSNIPDVLDRPALFALGAGEQQQQQQQHFQHQQHYYYQLQHNQQEQQRAVLFGCIKHKPNQWWRACVKTFSDDYERYPSWKDEICDHVKDLLHQNHDIHNYFVQRDLQGCVVRNGAWSRASHEDILVKTKQRFLDERKLMNRRNQQQQELVRTTHEPTNPETEATVTTARATVAMPDSGDDHQNRALNSSPPLLVFEEVTPLALISKTLAEWQSMLGCNVESYSSSDAAQVVVNVASESNLMARFDNLFACLDRNVFLLRKDNVAHDLWMTSKHYMRVLEYLCCQMENTVDRLQLGYVDESAPPPNSAQSSVMDLELLGTNSNNGLSPELYESDAAYSIETNQDMKSFYSTETNQDMKSSYASSSNELNQTMTESQHVEDSVFNVNSLDGYIIMDPLEANNAMIIVQPQFHKNDECQTEEEEARAKDHPFQSGRNDDLLFQWAVEETTHLLLCPGNIMAPGHQVMGSCEHQDLTDELTNDKDNVDDRKPPPRLCKPRSIFQGGDSAVDDARSAGLGNILDVVACLNPDKIERQLLPADDAASVENMCALRILEIRSMNNEVSICYSIPHDFQAAVRQSCRSPMAAIQALEANGLKAFSRHDVSTWSAAIQMLPHVESLRSCYHKEEIAQDSVDQQVACADVFCLGGHVAMWASFDYVTAKMNYMAALEIYTTHEYHSRGVDPNNNHRIATTKKHLGRLYQAQQDYASAHQMYMEALIMMMRAGNENAASHVIATTLHDLGRVCVCLEKRREAMKNFQTALQMKMDLREPHGSIALTMANIARIHQYFGRFQEALDQLADIEAIKGGSYTSIFGATSRICEGQVCQEQGDWGVAKIKYLAALEIYHQMLGKDTKNDEIATAHSYLGKVLVELGDLDGADFHLNTALEMMKHVFGATAKHENIANVLLNMGQLYQKRGNNAAAQAKYREARSMVEECNTEEASMPIGRHVDNKKK